jgi:hypothetical protein
MNLVCVCVLFCVILGRSGADDWHWNLREQLMGEAKTSDPTDDKYNLPLPHQGAAVAGDKQGASLTPNLPPPPTRERERGDEDDDRRGVSVPSVAEVISKSYMEGSSRECRDQPPYLYVTLHDYSNILKYTLDGCLVDHKILGDSPIRDRVAASQL